MRIELIKFLAAGGSCFALELFVLWTLTELGGINYLWSAGAAFSSKEMPSAESCASVS